MRILTPLFLLPFAFASNASAQGTDNCTSPTPISGLSSFAFNTSAATTTTGAGATCNGLGRDLFWVWTAPSAGNFTVSTCGTASFDTVIAVYAGATCPAPAGPFLACVDDSCGVQSSASFTATTGGQYLIRLGSFNGGAGGAGSFTIGTGGGGGGGCTSPSAGPDVIVGTIPEISNHSTTGTLDAISMGTTSCNVGDANLSWIANNNQHPVIGGNLYRYEVVGGAGRFEQIGQSWLKHGFTALTGNECCTCSGVGGSQLGVGCSDPYGSGLNGSQSGLGPRWQVNAHTGAFTYPPANPSYAGNTARRCEFELADGRDSAATGARFFGEAQYVTPDDAAAGNQDNNASWVEFLCSGSSSNWTMTLIGGTHREESALRAWAAIDPLVTLTDTLVAGDGLYVVGSRATSLGGGQYRYEFAIYNMNGDRNVGTFSVPVPAGASITNVGFHDIAFRNGDGPGNVNFSGLDWSSSVAGGSITWSTQTQAQNASANAIRWGSTYNFRFDADVAPTTGNVSFGLWKTGSPGAANAVAQVPSNVGSTFTAFCFGDGSGTACPCGNAGVAGNGCASSVNANGANLAASGNPSIAADTMVLSGSGMPNSSALYFQGTSQAGGGLGTVFGDGLRCAGGSVIRLGTKTNASGGSQYPVGGDLSISVKGTNAAGNVRTYQCWYRNAASFCTADTFNLSNGVQCTWAP